MLALSSGALLVQDRDRGQNKEGAVLNEAGKLAQGIRICVLTERRSIRHR